MKDGQYVDLLVWLVDRVDNDVGCLHELSRPFEQARTTYVGQAGNGKALDFGSDAISQSYRCAGIS
nr:hypothetical protein [Bradyrhizobium forestalis]